MDSSLSLVPLEVLALPAEVVALILRHLHHARAAMRLGLTNKRLMTWLDSFNEYWVRIYEETQLDVSTANAGAASPKQRVQMGLQAIRHIEHPEFNSYYVLDHRSNLPNVHQMDVTVQHGSAGHALVVRDPTAPFIFNTARNASHLDLSQWPEHTVSNIQLPSANQGHSVDQVSLDFVGSKVVENLSAVEVHADAVNEITRIRVHHFNPASAAVTLERTLEPRDMPAPFDQGMYSYLPSSDSKIPLVSLCRFIDQTFYACVYNVESNRWSPVIATPKPWTNTFFLSSFNGEYLAIWYRFRCLVIRFDPATLEPRALFSGEFPLPKCRGDIVFGLSKTHLLVHYLATNEAAVPGNTFEDIMAQSSSSARTPKLGRVSFDDLERSGAIWSPEFEANAFETPAFDREAVALSIVSCGPLAILSRKPTAFLVDFNQRKVLKIMKNMHGDKYHFLDCTLFIAASYNAVVVVDMLARRENPMRAFFQLFCFNSTQQPINLQSFQCNISQVESTVSRLLPNVGNAPNVSVVIWKGPEPFGDTLVLRSDASSTGALLPALRHAQNVVLKGGPILLFEHPTWPESTTSHDIQEQTRFDTVLFPMRAISDRADGISMEDAQRVLSSALTKTHS